MISSYSQFAVLCLIFILSSTYADSKQPLVGLKDTVTVSRDQYGIAHIRAKNEHDLFLLQGYIHAQDRLFQMDVSRRRVSGTLAELLGQDAISSDVFFRTIGLRRAATRSAKAYSNRALSAAEAYTKGVNAYIAQASILPPEYAALEISHITPWTSLDVFVTVKLIGFLLSFDAGDIERTVALRAYQQIGQIEGFNGDALFFEDLFRSQPFTQASTVPDAQSHLTAHRKKEHRQPNTKIHTTLAKLSQSLSDKLRKIPELQHLLIESETQGSNEWAVSGSLTKQGGPLLANDPHLELLIPSTLYPIHLMTDDMNVIGSSFAGVPTVAVGHNANIAWVTTINRIDVVDYFQELVILDTTSPSGLSTVYQGTPEPIVMIPEVYSVNQVGDGIADNIIPLSPGNGVPSATLVVPRRNHGPIIEFDQQSGVAISVQYTGFSPTRILDTFLLWNSARNLPEFIEGLAYFDFGSESIAYMDIDDNIAYFTTGEMPLREDLQAGIVNGLPPFFIRNGQGGNEWIPATKLAADQAIAYEILPFKEMPHTINPPQGWFVNANNDPIGVTLDNNSLNSLRPDGGIYYLHGRFEAGIRAGRITQLIAEHLEDKKLSFKTMQAIQADTVMLDAKQFIPSIITAYHNALKSDPESPLASFAANARIKEAIGYFLNWNLSTPTGIPEGYDQRDKKGKLKKPKKDEIQYSVATTLYSVWRSLFIQSVIDNKLTDMGLPLPGGQQVVIALKNLLDNFDTQQGYGISGVNFFDVPGVTDASVRRDIKILQSLKNTLSLLSSNAFAPAFHHSTTLDDYRWGKLHRTVLAHPMGEPFSIPPAGGAFPAPLPGLPGIPVDGGFQVVDSSWHNVRGKSVNDFMFSVGPVHRFIAEVKDDKIEAKSIWPSGVSGILGHQNYKNLLPLWLSNDMIPLLTESSEFEDENNSKVRYIPTQ